MLQKVLSITAWSASASCNWIAGGLSQYPKDARRFALVLHSWGIAIDYDPDRNQLQWGRDRAVFAGPDYDAWWQFWEEEGWTSLGRTRNFDWMHVQAAKL